MANLTRQPGLLMSELADTLVMDRTTLLRALKPLQRDGFVATAASEHDTRAHALSLTKLGERTFAEAKVAWRAAQDEFETQFGRDRAGAARRTVQCDRGTLGGGLATNWCGIRAIGCVGSVQWRKWF